MYIKKQKLQEYEMLLDYQSTTLDALHKENYELRTKVREQKVSPSSFKIVNKSSIDESLDRLTVQLWESTDLHRAMAVGQITMLVRLIDLIKNVRCLDKKELKKLLVDCFDKYEWAKEIIEVALRKQ